MAHDHRMRRLGEPYLNRKIMNTPQDYLNRYPRLLHSITQNTRLPDDRAINLIRRHQENLSTFYEKTLLSQSTSSGARDFARSRKPSRSYYTQPQRPFSFEPEVATEDY